MNKKAFVTLLTLLIVLLCFLSDEKMVDAKRKTVKYHKIYIACQETYNIYQISKDTTKDGETLFSAIKGKKVKWSCSNKNVVIKKKVFRTKRAGKYRLIAKSKTHKYVLPIVVAPKQTTLDSSQFSKTGHIVIWNSNKGGEQVLVTNPDDVKLLCEKISQTEYVFNYRSSQHKPKGWSYKLVLYTMDNQEISTISPSTIYKGQVCYYNPNSNELKNYIKELFNKYYVVN